MEPEMYILEGWSDGCGILGVSSDKNLLEEYRELWNELYDYDKPTIRPTVIIDQEILNEAKKKVKAKRRKAAIKRKRTHCPKCDKPRQKKWVLCPYCGKKLPEVV